MHQTEDYYQCIALKMKALQVVSDLHRRGHCPWTRHTDLIKSAFPRQGKGED